jgi:(p)ppGpp synthase/HD superfamily hydrolase
VHGYSDRINHALAFAAKHHDQQVRKGTRAPYITQPANVAVMLTRYGRSDTTVVAGILHGVVEDLRREGAPAELLDQRIGDKFGAQVLSLLLSVTERRVDDDGVELSPDERPDDVIARLAHASPDACWVCAADKLHSAATLAADLRRTVDPTAVWHRTARGGDATLRWYRNLHRTLTTAGFDAAIMQELGGVVDELEALAARQVPYRPRT